MQINKSLIDDISAIWKGAQNRAYNLVNRAMVDAYWEIGRRIVEEEQHGEAKAAYGQYLIRELAVILSREIHKQFDERELRKIRQFYRHFPDRDALRPELTWSHYRLLLRVDDQAARGYYLTESATQAWGTRQLARNIQSLLYERILTTKRGVDNAAKAPADPAPPCSLIKDPYLFDFLDLQAPISLSETDLETALIGNIQEFLLEMGNGFAFVGRQFCIKTDTRRYYIDLVFYNFILKCFVIADLKIGELTHQDIGQMDMYLRMFDDLKRIPGDNPTIGIILCNEKDDSLVKYSVLDENKHLFASRYRLILPSEQQLSDRLKSARSL